MLLPLFILLALLPDFDYFSFWIFKINAEPRFTHSLAFCLAASTLAWVCLPLAGLERRLTALLPLSLASCSHLALDLLVGVHPLPVFWPLPVPEIQSLVGLLPSAGHLSPGNYYLWRNLAIECGVLFPVLAFFIAVTRKTLLTTRLPKAGILLLIWIAFLAYSIHIH